MIKKKKNTMISTSARKKKSRGMADKLRIPLFTLINSIVTIITVVNIEK